MVDPVYFASIERLKGIMGFLQKLFGSHSDHELKRIYPIADKIEALEPQMQALSDEQLRAKTDEFKARYQSGEDQIGRASCRERV